MTLINTCDTAVVIPARNEARRITACIEALAAQADSALAMFIVVNNTQDETAALARDCCRDLKVQAEIAEIVLPPEHGVGTARRIGADMALRKVPRLKHLLSTDADSIVAADWIERNRAHLVAVDAVCGHIRPISSEIDNLTGMDPVLSDMESDYRALVLRFYGHYAPDGSSASNHHGDASGASLGFRVEAYRDVGGFSNMRCSEDRDIARRLKAIGRTVRHAEDVTVRTSLRLRGRAPGGMSDALRARTCGGSYTIDESLPPAEWLWLHRSNLPIWPHDGRGYDPIEIHRLAPEIAALKARLALTERTDQAQQNGTTPTRLAGLREAAGTADCQAPRHADTSPAPF